jgi:hypothetical protein
MHREKHNAPVLALGHEHFRVTNIFVCGLLLITVNEEEVLIPP